MLYVDLDNFKAVNDSLGHAAGDLLIKDIGAAVRDALRLTDFAGRLGGDEVAVLLGGVTDAQAEAGAARIQAAVRSVTAGREPAVSATIGLAIPQEAETFESLLSRADEAMYRGKASAKGSICIAAAPDSPAARRGGAASA